MSMDTVVFVNARKLISCEQWQAQICDSDFPLQLEEFNPATHVGFLPCILEDEECGFEYFVARVDKEIRESFDFVIPEELDLMVSLTTRSSFTDLAAATIAGATLVIASDGAMPDEESHTLIDASKPLPWARKALSEFNRWRKEEDARAERANAIMEELGDDQTAIDNMFAQVLEGLVGLEVKTVSSLGSISLFLGEGRSVALCAWEAVAKDGARESRIESDDEKYADYGAARDAVAEQSVRVTAMLAGSATKLRIASASVSSDNDIRLKFDSGATLTGKASPYFVSPWEVRMDVMRWFCDMDGINNRPI